MSLSVGSFDAQQIDLSFFNVLSLVSWVAVIIVLLFNIKKPALSLGIIIFPFSALAVLLQAIGLDHGHMMYVGIEVKTHILLSILAFSLLVVASVQAVLFAIQERHLRNHHAGGFVRRLPPMETMESFLFQLIRWGFIALTLAIFNGLLFLEDMFQQHMVHKSILSIVAWFVFAILLWGRRQFGWRGRIAIRWTLAGFITLLLAYFGSKLVLELILQ
jgi:ABC-type uncharacterized transport system permease subunit